MTGTRDLACPELWERSLERSRRRRELAAQRRPGVHAVSAVALAATLASPAAAGATLLRTHSHGAAVADAQRALGVSADGEFGPLTRRAVRAFQRAHGLEVDGIIGPMTRAALGLDRGPKPSPQTTRAIQARLGLAVDGVYGPITRGAVIQFQRVHGLEVDGVVGPQTLGALGVSGAGGGAPSSAVAAARSQLGAAYKFGGVGDGGWDCSGLTQWAMGKAGVSLPRTSYSQYGVGTPVERAAIQAGDLVFFDTDGTGASHVGIATGPGSVISATTHGVMEHEISGGYWGARYVGARRVG
jgi:peptidoglycan hydrolase-like protein with peptidoglycan-binding domain